VAPQFVSGKLVGITQIQEFTDVIILKELDLVDLARRLDLLQDILMIQFHVVGLIAQ
jgi:hypothetical protein